jgi:hypothetical protein
MLMGIPLGRWIGARAILRFARVDLPELETDYACNPRFEDAIERSTVESGLPEAIAIVN